jgi:hypothetical protein
MASAGLSSFEYFCQIGKTCSAKSAAINLATMSQFSAVAHSAQRASSSPLIFRIVSKSMGFSCGYSDPRAAMSFLYPLAHAPALWSKVSVVVSCTLSSPIALRCVNFRACRPRLVISAEHFAALRHRVKAPDAGDEGGCVEDQE